MTHPILAGQIQEKKELYLRHVRRRAIFCAKILEKKCVLYAVKYGHQLTASQSFWFRQIKDKK